MAREIEVGLGVYSSVLNLNDLSQIRAWNGVPLDFDLELPGSVDCMDNPPPSRLCVYEVVLRVSLRFFVPLFILDLFHFCGIFLYAVIPNSFRLIIGFLVVCVLANTQPSISLFRSFFTIKKHPGAKG